MKLLLTSEGLTEPVMERALYDLIGKPPSRVRIACIPTAIHLGMGDKRWMLRILNGIEATGPYILDIVDISALPRSIWLQRLEQADAMVVLGGNTPHLMHWIERSGLKQELPRLLQSRVYVGNSAGSTIAGPDLSVSNPHKKSDYTKRFGYEANTALSLVPFHIRCHLGRDEFPHAAAEAVEELAASIEEPVYAISDNNAIMVNDNEVTVIGSGDYIIYE